MKFNNINLKAKIVFSTVLIFSTIFLSCNSLVKKNKDEDFSEDEGEFYQGGRASTVQDETEMAFNNPIPGLSVEENTSFVSGNSFNRNNWVVAGNTTSGRDGLGPFFNAASCSSCHVLDGRGKAPDFGEESVSMVIKWSVTGEDEFGAPKPIPNYGDQLNSKSIGQYDSSVFVKPEGKVSNIYDYIKEKYPDGSEVELRQPLYQFTNLAYGSLPSDFMFSARVAPKMTGTGIFDAISEQDILKNADENDINQDGISGKPNYVFDYINKKVALGRIGWKAGQASVANQVAHAFLNDIGITSSIYPEQNLFGTQKILYSNLKNGGEPEISDEALRDVVYYTSALAMPTRRSNFNDEQILKGKSLFKQIGCTKCHVQQFQTSVSTVVPQLSNQKVFIYSDLLLHDMGYGLADERPEFKATGREWRTSPLWGLSYYNTVNKHTQLLHDGRARNVEEAILWHGGEASQIKSNFKSLSKIDRDLIINFINTL